MSTFLEFAQILEEKIKSQLISEINTSSGNPNNRPSTSNYNSHVSIEDPSYFDLFSLPIEPQLFNPGFNRTQYKQYQKSPVDRAPHKLSDAQIISFKFFERFGSGLKVNFSKTELKSNFRTLAKKLHPDQGGEDQLFIELKRHLVNLEKVFSP